MFVSIGNSRMDKKFNCTDMTYEDFVSRLSKTKHTAETMEQYRKMPKGQQDNIKDVGGFVLGKLKGGRRKKDCVISRSAITLDMDYGTQGIIAMIESFSICSSLSWDFGLHWPRAMRRLRDRRSRHTTTATTSTLPSLCRNASKTACRSSR